MRNFEKKENQFGTIKWTLEKESHREPKVYIKECGRSNETIDVFVQTDYFGTEYLGTFNDLSQAKRYAIYVSTLEEKRI